MFSVSHLLAHEMPDRQCVDVRKCFPTCVEGNEDKTDLTPHVTLKDPTGGRTKPKKSSTRR